MQAPQPYNSPRIVPPFGSEAILMPIACAFWGATCVQTFIYFLHFSKRDSWWIKALVIWLWVADTVHIILSVIGVYDLSVSHWGDSTFLYGTSQNFLWSLMFTALVACSAQLFFTRRIWILNPRNPVCYILPFLAIAQPTVYTAFLILCYVNLGKFQFSIVKLLLAEWALSATSDVLIAMSLLYFVFQFRQTKTEGRLNSTNQILERIVVLTINTGVWTATCSLFSIITATAFKTSPAFTAVAFLICPLYCNTLLANLNMRESVKGNDFSAVSHMNFAVDNSTTEGHVSISHSSGVLRGETIINKLGSGDSLGVKKEGNV